ncbi:piggyBac transposable element-derived protein 2-like [Watersipora subatra]|uniref:piggyBac transposable element-derived protein 2-like n=1 Tax=Watersipora subatra TaxID=2589382 RepID=UPI00355B60EA
MMCKFRGKTNPIRQYIKGKPHPWGFKIWGRAGTIRKKRLPGCDLEDEKALKKRGQGAYDYRIEETNNITAVRWYDNRAGSLLSIHKAVEPLLQASHWNKAEKTHIDVPILNIVSDYNQHISGIDLLDQFLAAYRFRIRSRRWYLYLFWHFVPVGMVNAGNTYRKQYKGLGLPVRAMLNRRRFQSQDAAALVLKDSEKRRG